MKFHKKLWLFLLATVTSVAARAYDTNYEVCVLDGMEGQQEFFINFDYPVGNGSRHHQIRAQKAWDTPFDLSNHDFNQLYLEMDVTIEEKLYGDAQCLNGQQAQIELCSGGKNDVEELTFTFDNNYKPGRHKYLWAFRSAGSTGGTFDPSRLNFMRIYCIPNRLDAPNVETPWEGKVTFTINSIRIVDRTLSTTVPAFFSDGMLFQQQKPMNIWGKGVPGKNITLELSKNGTVEETINTTIASDSTWHSAFTARNASYDKYAVSIKEDGESVVEISDILIGDLFIAGGQSNMELTVNGTQNAAADKAAAHNNSIRFLIMGRSPWANDKEVQPMTPVSDIPGAYWGAGDVPQQVGLSSAVAYYCMSELQEQLGYPVGYLITPVGGSIIEAWMPREEVEAHPELVEKMKARNLYQSVDQTVTSHTGLSVLYNQKVGPMAGMNVKGAIWYQGCSNADRGNLYGEQLDVLKKGWEKAFNFNAGEMPFVFCQVGRWAYNFTKPQALASLDEGMFDGWNMSEANRSSMGILPTYDTDQSYTGNSPIHPTNKKDVGHRFFTELYNLVYNKGAEYTAPYYIEKRVDDNGHIFVKFAHVGDGLRTKDGNEEVRGFTIAGANGIYTNANARIVSADEVEVWNDMVSSPVEVTYAFNTFNYFCNLMNSIEVTALPFRSDRSADVTHFNPQDWTYADSETFWTFIKNDDPQNSIYDYLSDYHTAWKSDADTRFELDKTTKAAGIASIKVAHTAKSTIGPRFLADNGYPYLTLVPQLNTFGKISVAVRNNDNAAKSIAFSVTTPGGKVYTTDATDILPSQDFRNVEISLAVLYDETGKRAGNAANILTSVSDINFVITSDAPGSINIDNILFGSPAEPDYTEVVVVTTKEELKSLDGANDQLVIQMDFDDEDIATLQTYLKGGKVNVLDLSGVTFPDNEIPYNAFKQSAGIGNLMIPASVKIIQNGAFYECNIRSLSIPDNSELTIIGTTPSNRENNNGPFMKNNISSVVIPAGVEIIGFNAFQGNTDMSSLTFAKGSKVYDICDNAFNGCAAIEQLVLPASLKTIRDAAFSANNGKLRNVVFESTNLQDLCTMIFSNQTNLESITFNCVPSSPRPLWADGIDKSKTSLIFPENLYDQAKAKWANGNTVMAYLPFFQVALDEKHTVFAAPKNQPRADVTLNLTVEAGMNAYILPFALDNDAITAIFGTGTEIARFTGASDTELMFEHVVEAIQANVPFIVTTPSASAQAENSDAVTLTVDLIKPEVQDVSADGFTFTGTHVSTAVNADNALISDGEAFIPSDGGASISGFRAYFVSNAQAAKKMAVNIDGTTTGIIEINTTVQDTPTVIYDLNGRRVAKATKGIYIINGKKVIVL